MYLRVLSKPLAHCLLLHSKACLLIRAMVHRPADSTQRTGGHSCTCFMLLAVAAVIGAAAAAGPPSLKIVQELALDAVQTVARAMGNGQREVDIKNYAKVEKIPGGTIEDCKVGQARRHTHTPGVAPRMLLLWCVDATALL